MKKNQEMFSDIVSSITGGSVYLWIGDIVKSVIVGVCVGVLLHYFRKIIAQKK